MPHLGRAAEQIRSSQSTETGGDCEAANDGIEYYARRGERSSVKSLPMTPEQVRLWEQLPRAARAGAKTHRRRNSNNRLRRSNTKPG